MDSHYIKAEGLSKTYGKRSIIAGIDVYAAPNRPAAIVGPNGSGKTTLLEILCGIRRPTTGSITFMRNGTAVEHHTTHSIGFVSPRLRLYDELTAEETIRFAAQTDEAIARGMEFLAHFGLSQYKKLFINRYSTGMLQRLKIIIALMNDPLAIFLDEPTTNLDEEGKKLVFELLRTFIAKKIIVIATNDPEEASLCSRRISLGK